MDNEQLKAMHNELVEKLISTENPDLQRDFLKSVEASIKTHKENTIESVAKKLEELKKDLETFQDLPKAG